MAGLCAPAITYLAISMFALIFLAYQNLGNFDIYCVGYYQCENVNTSFIFLLKFMYIILWTWILNLICDSGNTAVSWFLVFLPVLLFFIMIAMIMSYRFNLSL